MDNSFVVRHKIGNIRLAIQIGLIWFPLKPAYENKAVFLEGISQKVYRFAFFVLLGYSRFI